VVCTGTHCYDIIQPLIYLPSLHGLSGVPTSLQHRHEEVRLAVPDWESSGEDWRTLATLWLCTETSLSKSGWTDLSFDQIGLLSIPDVWKYWMCPKVIKIDVNCPAEEFGKVFTKYLNELLSSTMVMKGTVMTEVWCCPGKTGIVRLLLCLYWQAEYAGAGHDWKVNSKRIKYIFQCYPSRTRVVSWFHCFLCYSYT